MYPRKNKISSVVLLAMFVVGLGCAEGNKTHDVKLKDGTVSIAGFSDFAVRKGWGLVLESLGDDYEYLESDPGGNNYIFLGGSLFVSVYYNVSMRMNFNAYDDKVGSISLYLGGDTLIGKININGIRLDRKMRYEDFMEYLEDKSLDVEIDREYKDVEISFDDGYTGWFNFNKETSLIIELQYFKTHKL